MSFSRKNKRRLVVGEQSYWYTARYQGDAYDWRAMPFLVFREDRQVMIRIDSPAGVERVMRVGVHAPGLRWIAQGHGGWAWFAYQDPDLSTFTPGSVRRVIDWCLDPTVERVRYERAAEPPPPADVSSPRGFGARLLRRRRGNLDAVVAVVESVLERPVGGELDPLARDLARSRRLAALLWETLATRALVPDAWVGDPSRRFLASVSRALPEEVSGADGYELQCLDEGDGPVWALLPRPPSLRAVLALAADPEGLVHAEALAREAVGRFEALCARREQHGGAVAWYATGDAWSFPVTPYGTDPEGERARPGAPLRRAVAEAFDYAGVDAPQLPTRDLVAALDRPYTRLAALAARDLDDASRWATACAEGLRIPAAEGVAGRYVGCRFGEVPDPYEPLRELWLTGYALDAWTACGPVLAAPGELFG